MVPCAVQLGEQVADLPDALGVEAVRRLVEDQQARSPDQRRGQAEPLPHAERVGPDRAAVDAAQTDPVEGVVDASPRGRRAMPPGPHGVEQREVRAARTVPA